MMEPNAWAEPQTIDDVTAAFPADVRPYLPEYGTVPNSFKQWGDPWAKVIERWFFKGIDPAGWEWKPGIDKTKALRQLGVILRSYQPKHEHKIAGAAYLLSQWLVSCPAIPREVTP
jgi:hypothetical protein